jgi:PadR family transcriptional regulator PadR
MPGYGRGRGRGAGRGPGGPRGRRAGGGRGLRRLLEPVLLLQLHRGASHGYGLLDGLEEFALGGLDASIVYRVLREMELEGWVDSTWDELQTQGPPRRVYRLTGAGERVLEEWARDLKDWRLRIDRFLDAYRNREPAGDAGKD